MGETIIGEDQNISERVMQGYPKQNQTCAYSKASYTSYVSVPGELPQENSIDENRNAPARCGGSPYINPLV